MAYVGYLLFSLLLILSLISQVALPSVKARNAALLVSSLLFYVFGGAVYILLLAFLTMLFWYCGMLMPDAKSDSSKKLLVAVPVVIALILLAYFKYTAPLLEATRQIFRVPQVVPDIVVPIGISIYTLNLISYLLEVYRNTVPPEKNFLTLLTYSSLFHLCLGGPILCYRDMRKRLAGRKPHLQNISVGVSRFAVGLLKVLVLAPSLDGLCRELLVRSDQGLLAAPALGIWVGVILSGVRFYLLLSGYADIAGGLGLLSGLRYPDNFDYPLLSCSVTDFYGKWFMSLSAFLADYMEKPIMGEGRKRKTLATAISCLLFGFWFGGSPNFLLLGVYLALAVFLEKHVLGKLPKAPRYVFGLLGIFTCFFLFSFTSLRRLGLGVLSLFGLGGGGFVSGAFLLLLLHGLPLIVLCICFCLPLGNILKHLLHRRYQDKLSVMTLLGAWESLYPLGLLILTAVLLFLGKHTTFLIV